MRALIGLGSNIGDRVAQLRTAVAELQSTDDVSVLAMSSVYESDPVGGPEQPDFLNAVVLVDTALQPGQLLARLHEIEQVHGRMRTERWGPRTLDLDLIDYEDFSATEPELTVPHPLATQRAFVMVPAAEVAADWLLSGRPLSKWAEALLPAAGLRLLAESRG